MEESCFIIMAISAQDYGDHSVTFEDLQSTYQNVLKPAILLARPKMNILRADECAVPGTITTDILTHLMYDTFVIADVTYPNPNVYYELGLRHCFKPGTILLKNADIKINAPFDISSQRYIEYQPTPKGIQDLAKQLKEFFSWYDKNSSKPDNQVLHLAQLIKFEFPSYGSKEMSKSEGIADLFTLMSTKPELFQLFMENDLTEQEKGLRLLEAFKDDPDALKQLLEFGQMFENK